VISDAPPEDALTRHVLGLLLSERERHATGEWLQFLSRTAAVNVASLVAWTAHQRSVLPLLRRWPGKVLLALRGELAVQR
jgi:hypothetical protein